MEGHVLCSYSLDFLQLTTSVTSKAEMYLSNFGSTISKNSITSHAGLHSKTPQNHEMATTTPAIPFS